MTPEGSVTAIRGALVTFSGDPFVEGVAATRRFESDAIVAMADGRIVDCGAAQDVSARLPAGKNPTLSNPWITRSQNRHPARKALS